MSTSRSTPPWPVNGQPADETPVPGTTSRRTPERLSTNPSTITAPGRAPGRLAAGSPATNLPTSRRARVTNALLGGKDNFAEDRQVVAALVAVEPDLPVAVAAAYDFTTRVTEYLSRRGITRIVDCTAGFPVPGMETVHDAARRANPNADVLYVVADELLAVHTRVLVGADQDRISTADPLAPASIHTDRTLTTYLDTLEPVAVLLPQLLHHAPATPRGALPRDIVDTWTTLAPPGSYLVITHYRAPTESSMTEQTRQLQHVFTSHHAPTWFRTTDQITSLFTGLDILQPGLVPPVDWWPPGPHLHPREPAHDLVLAGVARTPNGPPSGPAR